MCRGQQRAPHTRGHGKRRSIFTTVPAVSTRGVAISACLALRAYSDATHRILVHHLPVYRPPLPHTLVSDCTVPCRYVVHPGMRTRVPSFGQTFLLIKSVLINICLVRISQEIAS